MKIALYFGSFNPIHIGHLIIANFVVENEKVDELWFVVSPQNPFKNEQQLLNANHRLRLVQLAIENQLRLKASNIEFSLPKPSYTVDTLIYLKEKYPNHEFVILMGSDGYQNIKNWKNAEYILNNYNILVYDRIESKQVALNHKTKLLKAPLLNISATYIRNQIKLNKSIKYLVPDIVLDEIENQKFYREITKI
jgi:nicotinate-nucleotide adenylyltransferase